jgi:AraC-like DNA-binding protein
MERAMQLIRERYTDVVDVDQLAQELGLTLQIFIDRFRQTYSKSVERVVAELRIQACKRYLLDGRPLHVAGRNIGMSDPRDIIRLFKKIIGVTPNRWLREFRAKKGM